MIPIWCHLLLPYPVLFVFLLEFREVWMSGNFPSVLGHPLKKNVTAPFPKNISEYHNKIVMLDKFKPPENETKEFVYEEEKCGNLWNMKISDFKNQDPPYTGYIAKQTFWTRLGSDVWTDKQNLAANFPNKHLIVLDGCFFCPLIIYYEIKEIVLWQHTYKFADVTNLISVDKNLFIKQRVRHTKTGFTAAKTLHLSPFYMDTTNVYLEIKHNCSTYGQTYWQYIKVDGWYENSGSKNDEPFIYPKTRIQLCTEMWPTKTNCHSERKDPETNEYTGLNKYWNDHKCYEKEEPGWRCYREYNITAEPITWEEMRKMKIEKARLEFEEKQNLSRKQN